MGYTIAHGKKLPDVIPSISMKYTMKSSSYHMFFHEILWFSIQLGME